MQRRRRWCRPRDHFSERRKSLLIWCCVIDGICIASQVASRSGRSLALMNQTCDLESLLKEMGWWTGIGHLDLSWTGPLRERPWLCYDGLKFCQFMYLLRSIKCLNVPRLHCMPKSKHPSRLCSRSLDSFLGRWEPRKVLPVAVSQVSPRCSCALLNQPKSPVAIPTPTWWCRGLGWSFARSGAAWLLRRGSSSWSPRRSWARRIHGFQLLFGLHSVSISKLTCWRVFLQIAAVRTINRAQWFLMSFPIFF